MEKTKVNVESFEHACELKGIPATRPDFSGVPEQYRAKHAAMYELDVITDAQGEGFDPDYNDYSQKKWFPIFVMDDPGFRLYDSYFVCSYSYAGGGSRPLPTKEDSDYVATKFIHLFAAAHGAKKIAP